MKVTWYKGKEEAIIDDANKQQTDSFTKKGYSPKKEEAPKQAPKNKGTT